MSETLDQTRTYSSADDAGAPTHPALVVLWSEAEPHRSGEVGLVVRPCVFGRGPGESEDDRRVVFVRQRPGRSEPCGPISDPRISRSQLRLRPRGLELDVRSVGRCPMVVNGREVERGTLKVGDVVRLRTMVLGVVARPAVLPPMSAAYDEDFSFGRADGLGQVGESPAAWRLRESVSFVGGRVGHVLVLGAGGSGKELVARGIHALSARRERDLVARGAATIPDAVAVEELFGAIEDYPTPGVPARDGLIGRADGSSLLLDELGGASEALHGHLMRVLDADGEYTRLGETTARHADVRLIATTNRGADALPRELRSRFRLVVEVPGLDARMEDVPLLLAALLRRGAAADPLVRDRFMGEDGAPRLSAELVAALCRHRFLDHVRELDALLWQAISTSTGDRVELGHAVVEGLDRPEPSVDPGELNAARIQACLDDNDGVLEQTWRALGLKNRFQLIRLMRKYKLGKYAEG